MKKLFLLTLIVFLNSLMFAQGIPEKANTIVVTLPDSNLVVDKIQKVFTSKDYTLKKISSGYLSSPKMLKNNTRVNYKVEIKGADVYLTGRILIASQDGKVIEFKGDKGTPLMIAWEEMDKIAKGLGGKIKYETK